MRSTTLLGAILPSAFANLVPANPALSSHLNHSREFEQMGSSGQDRSMLLHSKHHFIAFLNAQSSDVFRDGHLSRAPLLALGRAIPTMAMGMPVALRRGWWRLLRAVGITPARLRRVRSPLPAFALYTVVFWVWHAAVPYQATLESDLIHAAEHLNFLAAALFLWQAVLVPDTAERGLRLLAIFGAAMQATLLSALLTFAPTPGTGATPTPLRCGAWTLSPTSNSPA
jgi:hypothetical protein